MCRFIPLLLFIIQLPAFGQKTSQNKQAQLAYEQAGSLASLRDYEKAAVLLTKAISLDAGFIAAYQQLGDISRLKQDYETAKVNYRKVISLDPEFYRGTYLNLGECELNTGEYEPALGHLNKYAGYPGLPPSNKTLAAKYITDCTFSLAGIKHPVAFKPERLPGGVNTSNNEYFPVLTADGATLIFTRLIGQNEDFYKSVLQNGQWSTAAYLSKEINSAQFNEGAQCISPDGLYLFFTGCNRPDGLGRCDIYLSRREGKEWSKPFNIGGPVNTPGWESQPSVSPDGRTLYFVSNRAGGIGGYDIWKSDLQEGGSWSPPVNLGPTVNTPYDEQSPFIHPDNETLYFSSSGWPGFGRKDLFLTRKNTTGQWQTPQNLGYPINSFAEENGLTISNDGKTAFYSTIKPPIEQGMDIYSFDLPASAAPKPVTYVKGIVTDKKSGENLFAGIRITDVSNGTTIYDDSSDPETGEFLATLPAGKIIALTIEKDGYLFYSENFKLTEPASVLKPFFIKAPLEKIELGGLVVLNNIFFDTNKYDLLPESKTELHQLIRFMSTNKEISIEIGGHTDNTGNDKLNQLLSENRAKSVYDFLVTNKISAARLRFKGYGSGKPMAENLTEEGRKTNRRTEFRIVGK